MLVVATATRATSALASEIDPSKWASIFEANYNNGDQGLARAQRKGWSKDMKEAYDEWLDQRITELNAKVINIGKAADTEGERATANEQRLTANQIGRAHV